jgi:hypothetical protein
MTIFLKPKIGPSRYSYPTIKYLSLRRVAAADPESIPSSQIRVRELFPKVRISVKSGLAMTRGRDCHSSRAEHAPRDDRYAFPHRKAQIIYLTYLCEVAKLD